LNVYVVTTGDYSDYHIEAIFSTKELADEYVRRGGDEYEVDEWELDTPIPDALIRVSMFLDGRVDSVDHVIVKEIKGSSEGFYMFTESFNGDVVLIWYVKTDSEERAIKVVNEKRIQILALGIWGDEEKVKQMISGATGNA